MCLCSGPQGRRLGKENSNTDQALCTLYPGLPPHWPFGKLSAEALGPRAAFSGSLTGCVSRSPQSVFCCPNTPDNSSCIELEVTGLMVMETVSPRVCSMSAWPLLTEGLSYIVTRGALCGDTGVRFGPAAGKCSSVNIRVCPGLGMHLLSSVP